MSRHIAIVEDEPAIRENYADALRRQGYSVSGYADRPTAMASFESRLPDLVIIDITLGKEPEGGFELCRQLRARSESLPIIFLTARDNELDAVSGLRLGADDYLTKDISLAHLTARVAALFRRQEALSRPASQESLLDRGPLRLDLDRMSVRWRDRAVDLTLTEFRLLAELVRARGRVRSRESLLSEVWGYDAEVMSRTVDTHVRRLRNKLGPAASWLVTVRGVGYRVQSPVNG